LELIEFEVCSYGCNLHETNRNRCQSQQNEGSDKYAATVDLHHFAGFCNSIIIYIKLRLPRQGGAYDLFVYPWSQQKGIELMSFIFIK